MDQLVRLEIIGDPLKVERVFRERDEIQQKHMYAAMRGSLHNLRDVWADLAPVAEHDRHPDPRYPSWTLRPRGTYRRSIKVTEILPFDGDNLIGSVESDDMPVARILESGSGIHAEGTRSRPKIRPQTTTFLAIPGEQMRVGPNRKRRGDTEGPDARFLKSTRGQRAQHVSRRARIVSAPFTKERFQLAARLAANEMKAQL